MKENMGERMARLEEKTSNIESTVDKINQKLDTVLETKADKSEVHNIRRIAWSAVAGVIGTLLSAVAYLLTHQGICLG